VSIPFDAGTRQRAARLAIYLYYPDGSSAVAEGTDLTVDSEFDYGGRVTDIQAAPELTSRLTPAMRLRIYPAQPGRATLRVTKRPPISET
jgi:hypothetical protein